MLRNEVRRLDIGIQNGIIAALAETLDSPAEHIIQAEGAVVVPGMIDIHVHLNEPGLAEWEGIPTGTAALAAGGCTTCFDMPLNGLPPTTTTEALALKEGLAKDRSRVDYGFWGGLVPGNLEQLEPLAEQGVVGYKAFLSAAGGKQEGAFREVDDATLYAGMAEIARLGKILALHAESEQIVSAMTAHMIRSGRVSALDYARSRPVYAEVEAVKRALFYARQTGCALHFVHISTPEAVEEIRLARLSGQDVTLETCPHYLVLTEDDMTSIGPLAKCAPPLRSGKEQEGLWQALAREEIDMITSDHSPCPPEMKEASSWFEIWGGISGAQSSLELLLGEGHVRRGLPLPLLCRALATNPAERFGLYSRKGEIALGMDADLALVEFAPYLLEKKQLFDRHKQNPYTGRTMECRVLQTMLRGKVIYDQKLEFCGAPQGLQLRKTHRVSV
ncbi:MAG: allantoinase [Paenibacillaceae bacterium]|nr:allantoinase [Paenibacillaceae bacterium]